LLERLKIFEFLAPYNFVLFDHNPEQLRVSRRAASGGTSIFSNAGGGTGGAGGNQGSLGVASRGAETTMQVTKARLVGPEVQVMANRVLGWLSAKLDPADPAALAQGAAMAAIGASAPVLLVQWGPPATGFTFTATLTQADVSYQRVSLAGIPTHAQVNMTLKEVPSILSLTNPTSGGRPGRSRHLVLADDSLASIATAKFGNPAAWRAIAEVNGIDDPTAIRPGDTIYLPASEELAELAGLGRP
jgi:nucleoid-associated protein YgaU